MKKTRDGFLIGILRIAVIGMVLVAALFWGCVCREMYNRYISSIDSVEEETVATIPGSDLIH